MPSESNLLRPWIMKEILAVKAPSTEAPSGGNYLGITSRRHESGGKLSEESNCVWFSDGEVTVCADFSEANAYIRSSLPNSFDPATSKCPAPMTIVNLVKFRVELKELPAPIVIQNEHKIRYTVRFQVDEFFILQPYWNMPSCQTYLCERLPGLQALGAKLLETGKSDASRSEAGELTSTQMQSPTGSSISSSILRAIASSTNSGTIDSQVLTQMLPSQFDSSLLDCTFLVCEAGEYFERRRRFGVPATDVMCQTEHISSQESQPLLQIDSDSLESTSRDTEPFLFAAVGDYYPSDAQSLPAEQQKVEKPQLSHSYAASHERTPRSPMLNFNPLHRKSRPTAYGSPKPETPKTAQSPKSPQTMSLINTFSAGRKGRLTQNSAKLELKTKPCLVLLGPTCDDIVSSQKTLERSSSVSACFTQNLPSCPERKHSQRRGVKRKTADDIDGGLGNLGNDRKKFTAAITSAVPLSDSILDSQNHKNQSLDPMSDEIVIVEPMTTASQLGLVDDDDGMNTTKDDESGGNPNDSEVKANSDLEWLDNLGHVAESLFDSFWGALRSSSL